MTNGLKPRFRKAVLSIVIIVVLVAVGWFMFGNRPDPKPENILNITDLSRDDVIRLIELKNIGLGHLENIPNLEIGRAEARECIKIFTELSEQLPQEPLGPQNLAIARMVMFLKHQIIDNREEIGRDFQNAKTALQKLEESQGKTFLLHLLRAKLAVKAVELNLTDDFQEIIDEYLLASQLEPDNPLPWTELYTAATTSSYKEMRAKIPEALKNSHQLLPENYTLLIDLLKYQIRAKDPSFVEILEAAEEKLRLFENTYLREGFDLSKSIADAKQAILSDAPEKDKWEIVSPIIRILNVVKQEPAYQSDAGRLEKYPLEFIIFDFSEEFYREANLPQSDTPSSVEVKFVKATGSKQLPELDDVVDAIFADFNLDARPDVIVLRKETLQVFSLNQGNEAPELLTEVTIPPGMEHVLAADLDWDFGDNTTPTTAPQTQDADILQNEAPPEQQEADLDLVVYGSGGALLLKNVLDRQTKTRTLEIVPQPSGIDELREVLAARVADLDHEGDLDLIFSSRGGISLWSNTGNFRFVNLSERSLLPPADWNVTDILPVDWDQNVTTDILLSGPQGNQAGYLENNFHSRFRWRSFDEKFAQLKGARSLALVDADANASWDVLSSGLKGIALTLTQISESGVVQSRQSLKLAEKPTDGLRTCDFDNDGLLDFFAWEADGEMSLFHGNRENFFVLTEGLFDQPPQNVRTCDVGDVDWDGDEDLLVVESGKAVLYHNEGGNKNLWIDITLSAESTPQEPSQRTNLHGIGSLLELKVGVNYQRRHVNRRTTHFGLGQQKRADIIRVLFPNGIPQNIMQPESRQWIYEKQRILQGSCPYLYTWSGKGYEFFTDCLWASPIGLQLAEGVLAEAREWEYLKIPGERLVAKDGEYRLQITEELWEAAYFDTVELIAVDHPADVEIYSNEKVGPAEIAAFKIHTVRTPRVPVSVRDQQGRDVLPQLLHEDSVYLKEFDQRIKQGLTPEHYIELDLGKLNDPKKITLFLTGWVFPSDTSLNVAISQNPDLKSPQPPSLWVPDKDKVWQKVMPYMGFPGGKTKTIAVDLSNVFLTDDYRVRIASTMEIYWDHLFFTTDEKPADFKLIPIQPHKADLHYRGFSRRVFHPGHGPETYDYNSVSTEPVWPPMRGKFTRYGDVTELMTEADNRLVILGAGDELTLRFRVPDEKIPAGWKRDFLLHNIGWDKDAALNTVLGQTVEPLPFLEMSKYPPPPHESAPDDPQYRNYLRDYQTRVQNRNVFWRQILRFRPQSTDRATIGH